MKIEEIEQCLTQSDAFKNKDLKALFALAIENYVAYRIDFTNELSGGDRLLFQWGTCDWGKGKFFEIDLTRQVMFDIQEPDDQSDSMQQLRVTFTYSCNEETENLGEGNRWCASPSTIGEFRDFLNATGATLWGNDHTPQDLKVNLGYI
ncbi:hypothetical protein ACO0K2_18560 [Undibacterium sp. MH2W]|uniref:hypothetical protein n=1 Tax=Undibacterium sp. MH2W TaxID=3413044 RepID=UPI003BEFD4FB